MGGQGDEAISGSGQIERWSGDRDELPAPWLPAWALPCEGEFGLARGVGAEDGEGLADGGGAAVAGDDGRGGGDGEGGEGVADGAHVFGDGFRGVLPLVVVVRGGEGGGEVGGAAGLGPCEEVGVAGLEAVGGEEIPECGEGGEEGEGEEDAGAEGEGVHGGKCLRIRVGEWCDSCSMGVWKKGCGGGMTG